MNRAVTFLLIAATGLFAPATATAQPDTTDTRLLSQPAVSAKHVAFIYADDLWVADLDGYTVVLASPDGEAASA